MRTDSGEDRRSELLPGKAAPSLGGVHGLPVSPWVRRMAREPVNHRVRSAPQALPPSLGFSAICQAEVFINPTRGPVRRGACQSLGDPRSFFRLLPTLESNSGGLE